MLATAPSLSVAQEPPPLPPAAQPGAQQQRDLTAPLPVPRDDFTFEIPPMIDRPLGVDEGARVFVTEFRVEDVLQDPAAPDLSPEMEALLRDAHTRATLLAEQLRIERQELEEVGADGFTDAERARIIEFMQGSVRGAGADPDAYQELVRELRDARMDRERGMTIGHIQQVADQITQVYRDNGLFLARAIIPAQDVDGGVVTLRVLEGRLGRVIADGNEHYREEVLKRPFADSEGQPITVSEVESSLFTLSDYPGLQAFGTFRPGREVGTSDLVINVQEERKTSWNARADNYGTEFTGKRRASLGMELNNLTGRGDVLGVTGLYSFEPENTVLGNLSYRTPLFGDPRNRARFELSRNTFDISGAGFEGANIGGISHNALLGFERVMARGRNYNYYVQFDVSRKRGETLQQDVVFNQDDLAVAGAQVRFDQINPDANSLSSGFLRLDYGLAGVMGVPTNRDALDPPQGVPPSSRLGATPEFLKLSMGYSFLKMMNERNSLLFRFSGQYSDDMLTSLEQFSVGGPNQVRGAPSATFLADKGAFASLEWIMRVPFITDKEGPYGRSWGEVLSFSLFTDHTLAYNNEPLREEDRRIDISGYGVGMNFSIPGAWAFKVQYARLRGAPHLGTGPTDPTRIEERSQTWFEWTYEF